MINRPAKPEKLRLARKRAGLSLEEAAERAGMSHSQASRLERGIGSPTLAQLRTFAKVYRTQLLDVIDFELSFLLIPIVDILSIGDWDEVSGLRDGDEQRWVAFMPLHDEPVPDGALVVTSEEVNLEYPPGTVVFFKRVAAGYQPKTGQYVIVHLTRDGAAETLFREVQLTSENRVLLNPKSSKAEMHPVLFDPAVDQMQILAVIISSQKRAKVI